MKYTLSKILIGSFIALPLYAMPAQAQLQNFNRASPPHAAIAQADTAGDEAPPPAPAPQATDVQVRMSTLENLVRHLTGQVEQLQFSNAQLLQQVQKMNGDNDVRFRDLEQKVGQQDVLIKNISAQQLAAAQAAQNAAQNTAPATSSTPSAPASAIDAPAPEKKPEPKTEATKPETKTEAKPPEGGTLGTISKTGKGGDATAQADYDAAFDAMRHAKYDIAQSSFEKFLKDHPKHRLTENAKYWLAETFYVRGQFSESAVAFAEGYEQFPKGGKAADNLLKLAMSLGSLGKKQDACLTLSELSKNFPKSPAVTNNRVAQEKKSLGCS